MPTLTVEHARSLFTSHGLRITRQREVIYLALRASHAHPTAEELHRRVQHTDEGISLATVYNALDAFTHAGLARRLAIAEGAGSTAFRFEADMSDHCHVVGSDGSVRDVPHELGADIFSHIPAEVLARIEREMGIRVGRINVEFIAAE